MRNDLTRQHRDAATLMTRFMAARDAIGDLLAAGVDVLDKRYAGLLATIDGLRRVGAHRNVELPEYSQMTEDEQRELFAQIGVEVPLEIPSGPIYNANGDRIADSWEDLQGRDRM